MAYHSAGSQSPDLIGLIRNECAEISAGQDEISYPITHHPSIEGVILKLVM